MYDRLLQYAIDHWLLTASGAGLLISFVAKRWPTTHLVKIITAFFDKLATAAGVTGHALGVAISAKGRLTLGIGFWERIEDFIEDGLAVVGVCVWRGIERVIVAFWTRLTAGWNRDNGYAAEGDTLDPRDIQKKARKDMRKTLGKAGMFLLCLLIPAVSWAQNTQEPSSDLTIGRWKIAVDYPIAGIVLEPAKDGNTFDGSIQTIPGVALMGRFHTQKGQEVLGIGGGLYIDAFLTESDNQKVTAYPAVIISVLKWVNIGITWEKGFLGGNLPIGK